MLCPMSKVEVQDEIEAPVADVWKLVSDFTGFLTAQGIPCTGEGEGIGMVRTIAMRGMTIKERLEELDDATYTTSYSLLEHNFPFTDYRAWVRLEDAGEGRTSIRWWGTFEPVGATETEVSEMISGIYTAGVAGIKKVMAQ